MGQFWFFHAQDNPKVACNLLFQHVLPMFTGSVGENDMAGFKRCLTPFWERDTKGIIESKLRDEAYKRKLRHVRN